MRKLVLSALSILILSSMVLAGCATATPETIIQTVEVPKEVKVVETQIVTQEVIVQVTAEPAEPSGATFERSETLYTGGTNGDHSLVSILNLQYVMGTFGHAMSQCLSTIPTDEFTLARREREDQRHAHRRSARRYLSDGTPLTGAEIKPLTISPKMLRSASALSAAPGSVELEDDYTVNFNFDEPLYQRWSYYLYSAPVVSKAHWEGKPVEEITSGLNLEPECTGPYTAESLDQTKVVWAKRDGWWATDALGLDPKPKRIVDIVNSGNNNVALGMVLQGQFDLNNNFLPGISRLVEGGYGVQTYFPGPPYHLSANTAWLLMNLTKKPMDDPAFRRAVAFAIDIDQIVNVVYGGMVLPSDPTGLLPTWEKYIDKAVVDEVGFGYDPEEAKAILAQAGYKDTDGDGFVEAPDGSKIELKINNPNGWTDWMEANRVITTGLQAAGINAQTNFPDYPEYVTQRNDGTFDMMINNDPQIANTPFRYYLWMAQNPIEDIATIQDGNYGRYDTRRSSTW
jgi:peptide/nickel transport system substrate-binding protein